MQKTTVGLFLTFAVSSQNMVFGLIKDLLFVLLPLVLDVGTFRDPGYIFPSIFVSSLYLYFFLVSDYLLNCMSLFFVKRNLYVMMLN